MVITDLDGTLLRDDKTISIDDVNTLIDLGNKGICRVAATGRSLHSSMQVLAEDFPIDYVAFSTGAGIVDWKTKNIILAHQLRANEVSQVSSFLIQNAINFTIHKPIPETHRFVYYHNGYEHSDFIRLKARLENEYEKFRIPFDFKIEEFGIATQLRAIIDNDVELFNYIKSQNKNLKVVRATSPLDGKSIWVEFFPPEVSKGNAIKWLCEKKDISINKTISIGNDYNDLDLLNITNQSFIVSNAPEDLKQQFTICKSNMNNGFTDAIKSIL